MKTFQVKFTAKNLTGNAGLVHLGKFAEKLQLSKTLKKVISIERGHTASYEVGNVVMMLMIGVLAGIKHIRACHQLDNIGLIFDFLIIICY